MTARIRTGSMDRLISVQERAETQDGVGGQSVVWTELKKVYARMRPLNAQERFNAQMLGTKVSHDITVFYDAIFADPIETKALRLVYGTRIFEINGPTNEDEADVIVTLHCSEGMTTG